MGVRVEEHRFGEDAFGALSAAVRRAQGDDALRPVTVLVDRGTLGLATRRRLAARPPGIANVRFTTWRALAAELAAPVLDESGARLTTAAMELEAVRSALAAGRPSRFAAARDQPATLRALTRTYRELATVPPEALDELARQSARAADVVLVVRAARARLEGCYDRAALLRTAAALVRAEPERIARAHGAVVVYLPGRLDPGERLVLDALADPLSVEVIVGMTGDGVADELARGLATPLGTVGRGDLVSRPLNAPASPWRAVPADSLFVRSAPTPDAEVLIALRHLMRRNAQGVPLDRMALVHGGAAPYPQLVHDTVRLAGIPAHGVGARTLGATVAGRVLLGVLALGDHDWRRDDVMAWLRSGPVLDRGRPVPAASWDVLSCEAGIVAGLGEWDRRLGTLARSREERARVVSESDEGSDAEVPDEDDAGAQASEDPGECAVPGAPTTTASVGRRVPAGLRRDASRCTELRAFVAALAGRFEDLPTQWRDWASWAASLLADHLGGPAKRTAWPDEEIAAFDAVSQALGSLGALDWVGGPRPGLSEFRAALAAELDRAAPPTARFGRGLLVGGVDEAVGLDLDVLCVVGMTDGAFPARTGDDVLVPDGERERAGPDVPLRGARSGEGRRTFFAALASAREALLLFPRGDQRSGRQLRPARVVLEALEHLDGTGRRLYPRDVIEKEPEGAQGLLPARYQVVPSYGAAVRDAPGDATGDAPGDAGDPISVADWKLRSLLRWRWAGNAVRGHFLARACQGGGPQVASESEVGRDEVLARSLLARAERRSRRFTRFDGLVEAMAVPSPARGAILSATGLEAYARCPRSYFFGHLLDVTVREDPEAIMEVSPLDRGTLIHTVLERLVSEEIDERRRVGTGSEPGDRLGRAERRLRELAEEEFAGLERHGLTGHRVLWQLEKVRILSDLRQFVRQDAAYRIRTRAQPLFVEARFGWDGSFALSIPPEHASVHASSGNGTTVGDVGVDAVGADASEQPARTVRFRGKIDRVDRVGFPDDALDDYAGAGGVRGLGVIDYKSGKPFGRKLPNDPVERGTRLQLPLYALAAASMLAAQDRADGPATGEPPVPTASAGSARAGYWFIGTRAAPTWVAVDEMTYARLRDVVATMVDGIEEGLFPANPGWTEDEPGARSNCRLCAFSAMCPPRRGEEWDRKQTDARLSSYVTMSRPE